MLIKVKYSLTKHVKKRELVELFLNLSDSFDENVPDVIWAGSEFEVDINQDDVSCDINYISTKKGGEFSIKLVWITPTGKKEKTKETLEKTKEKIEKVSDTKEKSSKPKEKEEKLEVVGEEDIWGEEDNWDADEDDDWDTEDFDDEW